MTGFVVERFSTRRMVADHKALYRRVLTERCQSYEPPHWERARRRKRTAGR